MLSHELDGSHRKLQHSHPKPDAKQVLLPAGERVTAVDSTREGEMCTWAPVGVRPSPPSLWAAISGAISGTVLRGPLLACALIGGKSTAIALATWARIERKWEVRGSLISSKECRLRWAHLDRFMALHAGGTPSQEV